MKRDGQDTAKLDDRAASQLFHRIAAENAAQKDRGEKRSAPAFALDPKTYASWERDPRSSPQAPERDLSVPLGPSRCGARAVPVELAGRRGGADRTKTDRRTDGLRNP